jgi:hypothetical protein
MASGGGPGACREGLPGNRSTRSATSRLRPSVQRPWSGGRAHMAKPGSRRADASACHRSVFAYILLLRWHALRGCVRSPSATDSGEGRGAEHQRRGPCIVCSEVSRGRPPDAKPGSKRSHREAGVDQGRWQTASRACQAAAVSAPYFPHLRLHLVHPVQDQVDVRDGRAGWGGLAPGVKRWPSAGTS